MALLKKKTVAGFIERDSGVNHKKFKLPQTAPLAAVLLLMFVIFSFTSEYFFQVDNFRNILANAAVTASPLVVLMASLSR
jgi:ribose/xylose/arabinose/galactoside ABC-type transport system permease subunit